MSQESILVVDGFSVLYRAFYAIPPTLTSPDGDPINAVFGFASIVFRAIDQLNPSHVCICFDRKEKTFRHHMYPEYKAQRTPPPDEFIVQIPILKEMLQTLNLFSLEKVGFEADDLMGTLSKWSDDSEMKSFLLTGDQDSFQLVSNLTAVAMSQRGTTDLLLYTPEKVQEKCGVLPERVIDLKALKGDASDNIPGVPGVGDKTAAKLLTEFGSFENIFQNLDQIKSEKLKEKLSVNQELAYLSKKLVTIDRDVQLDETINHFVFKPDWEQIVAIFKSFNFNSLVSRYQKKIDQPNQFNNNVESKQNNNITTTPKGDYRLIRTEKELSSYLPKLKSGFALDLETTSLDVKEAQIVGVALSHQENQGVYIPFNQFLHITKQHDETALLFSDLESSASINFILNPLLMILKPILEDRDIPIYTHNGKYEINVLKNYDIYLNGIGFDTMLAAHLLFPTEKVGLKELVLRHFSIAMTSYDDVVGKGKDALSFDQIAVEDALDYAAADADFTFRLTQLFEPLIVKKDLEKLLYEIELPTQVCLADMEREGVCIDVPYLNSLSDEFFSDLQRLSQDIYSMADETFNINSTKQLATILFEKLKLSVVKKTKTGLSTDSSVLEKLKDEHAIAKVLLEYRTLEKLQSTYVNALPDLIHQDTQRIHTSFNQTVAITGRLSSTRPNLQNIPIRSDNGLRIRRAFIPSRDNGLILSVDYSQIELRMMAHFSEDDAMMHAFRTDLDIHTATAALMYHINPEDVTKDQRYHAKAVNFGISYGQSAFGLSETIKVSRKEAKKMIDNYFNTYPKLKKFMDDTIQFAKDNGYVKTMFGRIRELPELYEPRQRQFGERMAVNTRVQGSAAEIMKIAMLKIMQKMIEKKVKSRMVIQVHDELVFDIDPLEKELMNDLVRHEMENAVNLNIPLKVDAVFGKNWQEIS